MLHNSKRSRLCGLVRRLTKFSLTPAHHSVQNHARDPPCNALIFNPPSSQIWAEKGFKPTHGILHQALTSTGYAPGISALLLNLTKIGIPDGERLRGITPLSLRVSPRGESWLSLRTGQWIHSRPWCRRPHLRRPDTPYRESASTTKEASGCHERGLRYSQQLQFLSCVHRLPDEVCARSVVDRLDAYGRTTPLLRRHEDRWHQ